MIESFLAETWIENQIRGNTELAGTVNGQIFSYLAPAGVSFPYIVFRLEDSQDEITINGARMMGVLFYSVKIVKDVTSFSEILKPARQIEEVLNRQKGGVSVMVKGDALTGRVMSCVRSQIIAFVEKDDGARQIRHLGGVYRLQVQAD